MTIPPHRLYEYISKSKALSMDQDRYEVRLLSLVVTGMLFYQLVEPGSYILFVSESLTHRTASLTHSFVVMGLGYYAAAALLIPHMVALAFFPSRLNCRLPRKLAAGAALLGSLLWGLLAYVSVPIDADWLTTVFGLRAAVDLFFGFLYGLSLNRQVIRNAAVRLARHEASEVR